MANFREVFTSEHTILSVVHVENVTQAVHNIRIAQDTGCNGAFLISMRGMDHRNLWNVHQVVQQQIPDFWVGVNYLGAETPLVFRYLSQGVPGLWFDNVEVDERLEEQVMAERNKKVRENSGWEGLDFGGVAFKYQRPVPKDMLGEAARKTMVYTDVITTSGPATGQEADPEKIRIFREAIGNYPLAIASGISPKNVEVYMPYTDAFLVATSLLVPGTEDFDPNRLRQLVKVIRGS